MMNCVQARISLRVFYLSITKKPQLAEIGPGTFLSAPFWLKSAFFFFFYQWRKGAVLQMLWGIKPKLDSIQSIKSEYTWKVTSTWLTLPLDGNGCEVKLIISSRGLNYNRCFWCVSRSKEFTQCGMDGRGHWTHSSLIKKTIKELIMHEKEDFCCVTASHRWLNLHTGGGHARLATVVFNHLTAVNHCFNASVHKEGWEEGRL